MGTGNINGGRIGWNRTTNIGSYNGGNRSYWCDAIPLELASNLTHAPTPLINGREILSVFAIALELVGLATRLTQKKSIKDIGKLLGGEPGIVLAAYPGGCCGIWFCRLGRL